MGSKLSGGDPEGLSRRLRCLRAWGGAPFPKALRTEDRRVAVPVSPNTKEIFTAVTPQSPSISGLTHDHPSSVAHQQRKKPDPRPPQAAGALKIALLGAHGEHVPQGALKELDHSTLLLRPLSVLCSSHLQAIPRPCGGIEQHLYSPKHHGNIGPQIPFCATRSTRAEHSVDT